MAGLLIVFISAMMGLTKWLQHQEDNFSSSSGNGFVEVSVEAEPDWKMEAEGELAYINERFADASISTAERKRLEEREKVLDYRLANSIEPLGQYSRESMIMNSSGVSGVVLLLTVVVAAGIVASEFSQGTIKMLLTRPVKRWKILTAKFLTVNLFGVLLMLVGYAVHLIWAHLLFQTGDDGQALVWNGTAVVEASVWGKSLYMLLLSFGSVFVTATFAFMIGSVFRSSSLAIGLSLFSYFTGSSIVFMLAKFEIVKYIVFTHMDLTQFETMPMVEGITLPFSLAVLSVYIVLFLLISYLTFTKRDVTA